MKENKKGKNIFHERKYEEEKKEAKYRKKSLRYRKNYYYVNVTMIPIKLSLKHLCPSVVRDGGSHSGWNQRVIR